MIFFGVRFDPAMLPFSNVVKGAISSTISNNVFSKRFQVCCTQFKFVTIWRLIFLYYKTFFDFFFSYFVFRGYYESDDFVVAYVGVDRANLCD